MKRYCLILHIHVVLWAVLFFSSNSLHVVHLLLQHLGSSVVVLRFSRFKCSQLRQRWCLRSN